jgi:hypothetical protein
MSWPQGRVGWGKRPLQRADYELENPPLLLLCSCCLTYALVVVFESYQGDAEQPQVSSHGVSGRQLTALVAGQSFPSHWSDRQSGRSIGVPISQLP